MSQPGLGRDLVSAYPAGPLVFGIVIVWVTFCAVMFAADPHGVGEILYGSTSAVMILMITFGPLARGVRPRRIWFIETVAGITLLFSLGPRPSRSPSDRSGWSTSPGSAATSCSSCG